jgi:tRNA A-37 threonylcarbamoyl transferase component Bud32
MNRSKFIVDTAFHDLFQRMGWHSCGDVFRWFSLPPPGKKPIVRVIPKTLRLEDGTSLDVYYKQYDYPHPSWKFLGRASKARCEFRNYAVFDRLGIRCARRLACGEERAFLGRLRRAFIMTQSIPEAPSLQEFVQQLDLSEPAVEIGRLRRALIQQLADMTRAIHQSGFFHNDLVWRNILVTHQKSASPMLWWIDCPRGHFVPLAWRQNRYRIKDLASLDKSASRWCSRTERLRFLLAYLGSEATDPILKQWARNILDYRRQRWPDDWR